LQYDEIADNPKCFSRFIELEVLCKVGKQSNGNFQFEAEVQ